MRILRLSLRARLSRILHAGSDLTTTGSDDYVLRFLPLIHPGHLTASRLPHRFFGLTKRWNVHVRSPIDQVVILYMRNKDAVVPKFVFPKRVIEPNHRVGITWRAVSNKHSSFRIDAMIFTAELSAWIIKTLLCSFILHRTITRRMDIDGSVRVALFATDPRKDVVGQLVNRSKLTDNL